jgi:hypothetical protein
MLSSSTGFAVNTESPTPVKNQVLKQKIITNILLKEIFLPESWFTSETVSKLVTCGDVGLALSTVFEFASLPDFEIK